MRRITIVLAVLGLVYGEARTASAQVEVEADPIAYALNGFSLHVASMVGSARVSVGTFGIDVPEWLHGNDGWDASFRGVGVKLDYLGSRVDGYFVGIDGGYMRMSYGLDGGPAVKRDEIGVGVRGGYRMDIGKSGLYVSPWVGLGYTFRGRDVVIGEERFDHKPITVFPTIHIGWRF